jgi:hypothetical protein
MSVGGDGNNPSEWVPHSSQPDPEWYPPPAAEPQWYPPPQPYSVGPDAAGNPGFRQSAGRSARRGRLFLVVAMAAAAGLIAVVLAVVAPGGTRSAQAAVIASVNNAVASKTAHTSLTLNINSGQMTGTGSGALDFTDGAMDMTMDMSSVEQGLTIRLIYLGGKIFEQLPQISQLYPGKSWLSLDLSGLSNASGGAGALNLGGNPAAMLRLLTQEGATVTPVGNSDVNGIPVKGYAVSIDSAFIQKQMSAANVPAWIRQAMSKVSFQDAVQTVFIDSSGKLVRDAVHMVISVPSAHQPSVTVDETLDLSDYGVPVSISAPPASQVVDFQQFLNQFAGQNG